MHLPKTTILPLDDPDLARRLLRQLIEEEPLVLMIVLGADGDAETTVTRADRFAGAAENHRRVVWIRDPSPVQGIIDGLAGGPELKARIPGARAFTLSFADEVRDVIGADEPVPSQFRIFKAYVRAEAP